MPRGTLEIVIHEVLWSIRRSYSKTIWSLPLTNVKWHSDLDQLQWLPNRKDFPPNNMTSKPSLTFTELRLVSMEHLHLVWHASMERLPFRASGSVHLSGNSLYFSCWDHFSRTYHVFSRLFTLNTPRYCLDLLWNRWTELTKLDRRQYLNILYQVCVFRPMSRWPPWPLIGRDIFDFFFETAERNSTKLDRTQDLNVLDQVYVFRTDRKSKLTVLASYWLIHFPLLLWNR